MAIKLSDYEYELNNQKKKNNNFIKLSDYEYKITTPQKTTTKKKPKKDILSTLGYIGKETAKGIGEFYEGSGKLVGAGLEQVGRLTSKTVDNPVGRFVFGKEAADYENNPFYQIGNTVTSKNTTRELLKPLDKALDKKSYIKPDSIVGQLPGAVGQVAAMVKNPISGLKGVALSTAGSGYSQAKQQGGTNLQSLGYGALNSAINTGTEAMFGGLGKAFGVGALDDFIAKGLTKRIANKTTRILAESGIKALGEGAEELVAGALNPIAQKLTYMPKEELSKLYANTNLLEDFIVGSIVSGLAQSPSTISDIRTQKTNQSPTSPTTAQTSQISDVTPQTSINTPTQTNVRETAQKEVETNIPELKQTKVVDKNNKPLKLYHGTNQAGFTNIDRPLFLTPNKEIASHYAGSNLLFDKNDKSKNLTKVTFNNKNVYNKKVGEIKRDFYNYTMNDLLAFMDWYDKYNTVRDTISEYNIEDSQLNTPINNTNNSNIKDISDGIYEIISENDNNDIMLIPKLKNENKKQPYSENRKIYEVNANITNPYIMELNGGKITQQDIKYAKDKGYDGIIGKNSREGNTNELGDTYVVFSQDQIIQTQPTTETPKQVEQKIEEPKKVAKLLNEAPEIKVDKSVPKELDKVAQQIINKGHYVDKLAKETGNNELTFKYDKTLSADAEGQYVVGNFQTDNNGKHIGKSVIKIWEPIEKSNMTEPFSDYLLHKHNIDRAAQAKPVFGEEVTADMSRQAVKDYEAKYPQFKDWSADINKFNKNQLRNMTEAGLTSIETEKLLNDMYGNYVRIQRERTGTSPITVNNGRIAIKSPIQKAKGGTSDILPLKETMAQQAIMIKRAIRRNDLGLELLKELGGRKQGEAVDLNKIVDKTDDGYTMTVFENGEPTIIDINEGLYDSLKPRDRYDWEDNLLMRGVQKAARGQRSVLTVDNPLFIATNFFKDIQDAPFNSKHPLKFVPNYLRAVKEIKSNGKLWQLYQANGGSQNTYFDYDMKMTKEPKGAMKWVEKIRNINEAVEQAPRLAEFISTIQDGKSITEAMYNAAEITTNFKRGGDITKALNRNGANFLNASIQGFEKQYRNIKGANGVKGYVSLLAKATVLGIAPAILNHLLLEDDEDYQDLPADTKDRFYLFKTGDNKFVKIPKGRVISIFGMAARRTLEKGQGNKEAYDGQWQTFINQLAPNNPLEDNILAPIIQAKTNKAWYGGEIVPKRLEKYEPQDQYDETTDSFSKFIAKSLSEVGVKVSPKKINYVIDQYSGGLGDILLPLGTPRAETNPLSAKFTVNSILTNKNSAKFYDTKERLTQKVNSGNASMKVELGVKYLNSVQSELNDWYKEKRDIELSDIPDDKKRKEVLKIQNKINTRMEEALKTYNTGQRDGSYFRVGDKYFEPYEDGTGKITYRKMK